MSGLDDLPSWRDPGTALDASAPAQGKRHARILLVEDNAETAGALIPDLAECGYQVTHAGNGEDGLDLALEGGFDLLIVDRLLPGLDGLTLVQHLRRRNQRVPVLLLSALAGVEDRIQGLAAGGDDYMPKPFAFRELAARVNALLRRAADGRETLLRAGPLELDLLERTARRRHRDIELLPREFKLLEHFMRHADLLVTREALLREVWNYRVPPHTNLIDVHVGKLRRKVDGPGEPPLLRSIRGFGFVLRAD
jgi:two-component system, OmpR family, response regulator